MKTSKLIEIQRIDDCRRIADIGPELEKLTEHGGSGLFSVHPSFLLPWLEEATQNKQKCAVLVGRAKGERQVVGMAPLVLSRSSAYVLGCKVLMFPQIGTTPPFEIVGGEDLAGFIAALLGWLSARSDWDVVWLPEVPADHPCVTLLDTEAHRHGMGGRVRHAADYFAVPLDSNWPAFHQGLRGQFRQNLRRGWKRLESLGSLEARVFPGDVPDLECALQWLDTVINRSWKHGGARAQEVIAFYGRLARSLHNSGRLRLSFLILNDRPITYLYEIVCEQTTYPFHIAYDLEFQNASPGQLILQEALRAAFDRGHQRYEFMGSREYLGRWSQEQTSFSEVTVVNNRMSSRLKARLHDRYRQMQTERRQRRSESKKDSLKETHRGRTRQDNQSSRNHQ